MRLAGLIAYDIARGSPSAYPINEKTGRTNLNGLDLSKVEVGDVIYLPEPHAVMLIREGWAERVDRLEPRPHQHRKRACLDANRGRDLSRCCASRA